MGSGFFGAGFATFLGAGFAVSFLGVAGIFAAKGPKGMCAGVAIGIFLRFACHFVSGCVIFKELEQFEIFGKLFENRPVLYSLGYNGFYMLPELVITVVACVILFRLPHVQKIMKDF